MNLDHENFPFLYSIVEAALASIVMIITRICTHVFQSTMYCLNETFSSVDPFDRSLLILL